MIWMRDAWRDVKKETLVNCWNHTRILLAAVSAPPAVIEENEILLDELRKLLLEFGVSGLSLARSALTFALMKSSSTYQQENRSSSEAASREICELSRMTSHRWLCGRAIQVFFCEMV